MVKQAQVELTLTTLGWDEAAGAQHTVVETESNVFQTIVQVQVVLSTGSWNI